MMLYLGYILFLHRPMVLAMLDRRAAKGEASGGAWEPDKEKLKDVMNCSNTHYHKPFTDLVDNLPGLQIYHLPNADQ